MASKTISLKKEAYDRLKRLKEDEGKSFSEVVIEITEHLKKDFTDLKGKDLDIDWKKVKRSRKRSKEDENREELLSRH